MNRSWVIGAREDCDLVVNQPTVSGRHCCLTVEGNEIFLEDLKSTNFTYVNGVCLSPGTRMVVRPSDKITLGQVTPLPWPPEAMLRASLQSSAGGSSIPTIWLRTASMVIGRGAECDHMLDLPMISTRHARVLRGDGQVMIEDLGSSNGTFVNGVRISQATPIQPEDRIGLGSFTVRVVAASATFVERAIPPQKSGLAVGPPPIPVSIANEASTHVSHPSGAMLAKVRNTVRRSEKGLVLARLLALLCQSPCIGLVILLILKAGAQGAVSSPQAISAALSWLTLAALWFGVSNAIWGREVVRESATDKSPLLWSSLVARLPVFAPLCLIQATLALLLIWVGLGLKGNVFGMLGLLALASGIGFALGLLVVALAPRPSLVWLTLPLVWVALWLFGGQVWRLPQMGSFAKLVACAFPSRWAFEGLLLLESERYAPATNEATSEGLQPSKLLATNDLAEPYFPAETDRMGERADTLALGAMFVGLMTLAAFISMESRAGLKSSSVH